MYVFLSLSSAPYTDSRPEQQQATKQSVLHKKSGMKMRTRFRGAGSERGEGKRASPAYLVIEPASRLHDLKDLPCHNYAGAEVLYQLDTATR